jgi:hypothetical protein
LEWFCAAVVVAAGSTLFGHFEEGTPKVRCLSRWVGYLGMVALLSRTVRGPGPSPTSSACLLSALSSTSSVQWCLRHGIKPLTAEPKDEYYRLRGWER